MRFKEWTRFGWQGIEFEMPEEWNLGKIDGDRTGGYLRMEDEEMVRLEAKWATAKPESYDLDREVANQVKQLEKQARKAKMEVVIRRKVNLLQLKDKNWECFYWRGDFTAYSLLTHCPGCGRVVLLRALFRDHEPAKEISRRIFGSMTDHRADSRDFWNVFGLALRLPDSFLLQRSSLKTGEIRLLFGRKKEELEAARISLAEYQLREASLDQWFEKFYSRELKPYRVEKQPWSIQGHPGLQFQGERNLQRRLLQPLRSFPRVGSGVLSRIPILGKWRCQRFYSLPLKCRVWHCKESDKLFILRALLSVEDEVLFDEVCASMRCHWAE